MGKKKHKAINRRGVRYAKACVRYAETVRSMADLDKTYLAVLDARLDKKELFTVTGNYGSLMADRKGHIVGWQDEKQRWCAACPKEYNMVRMFDIKDYLKHSKDMLIDVCEISDWDKDGDYTVYDPLVRKHVKSVQRGEGGFL